MIPFPCRTSLDQSLGGEDVSELSRPQLFVLRYGTKIETKYKVHDLTHFVTTGIGVSIFRESSHCLPRGPLYLQLILNYRLHPRGEQPASGRMLRNIDLWRKLSAVYALRPGICYDSEQKLSNFEWRWKWYCKIVNVLTRTLSS